ncbi:MAG: YihY/virulence factor BrkB family protein [Acidimicrobiales bacterium]
MSETSTSPWWRQLYDIVLATYSSWRNDRTIRLGAGLAYYGLFTIIPLLALTAALAEMLFGTVDMTDYLADRLAQIGVTDDGTIGAEITAELNRQSVQSSLGLIGVVSLLFASSLLFVALTDAIREIWGVPVESGFRETIQRRLIGFIMVLATGAVLIAGFALSVVAGAAEALVPGNTQLLDDLAELLTGAGSAALLAATIAVLYRYVGAFQVKWSIAFTAAAATSVTMILGTYVLGVVLGEFGGSSVSGAFGAILALLTWIYVEAQILLVGVQLSKVLALRNQPDDAARMS